MVAKKNDDPTPARVPTIMMAAGVPHDRNNGADVAPAVVVRVWSEELVNVRVLCDGPDVLWWTSVKVYADRAELESARESFLAESDPGAVFRGVCWPGTD
jgi:hypothetical protein